MPRNAFSRRGVSPPVVARLGWGNLALCERLGIVDELCHALGDLVHDRQG